MYISCYTSQFTELGPEKDGWKLEDRPAFLLGPFLIFQPHETLKPGFVFVLRFF